MNGTSCWVGMFMIGIIPARNTCPHSFGLHAEEGWLDRIVAGVHHVGAYTVYSRIGGCENERGGIS